MKLLCSHTCAWGQCATNNISSTSNTIISTIWSCGAVTFSCLGSYSSTASDTACPKSTPFSPSTMNCQVNKTKHTQIIIYEMKKPVPGTGSHWQAKGRFWVQSSDPISLYSVATIKQGLFCSAFSMSQDMSWKLFSTNVYPPTWAQ